MNFSENLKFLRERQCLSQNMLATLCELTQSKISSYENGHSLPSLGTALVLKDALDCEWGELLD